LSLDADGLFSSPLEGMQFRLEEMARTLGGQPPLNSLIPDQSSSQFALPNQNQTSFHSQYNSNPTANGQPSYTDLFNQNGTPVLPEFNNVSEVEDANTFLYRLLLQAQSAQQEQAQARSGAGAGPDGQQQHGGRLGSQQQRYGEMGGFQQNLHAQQQPPIQFDANILAQLGLSGAPGLDPNILYNQIANQTRQAEIRSQLTQQQQGFPINNGGQQQQQHQQHSNIGSALYPSLKFDYQQPISSSLPIQNQNQQHNLNGGRASSVGSGNGQNLYPSFSMPSSTSLINRPIAQLPSHRSPSHHSTGSAPASAPQLGMQTLLSNSAGGGNDSAYQSYHSPSTSSHESSPASFHSSPPSGSDYASSITSAQSVEQLFLGSDLASFPSLLDSSNGGNDQSITSSSSNANTISHTSSSNLYDFSSLHSIASPSLLPYPSFNLNHTNVSADLNRYATSSNHSNHHTSLSPTLQNSFDSLAPSRGASLSAGLAPGNDLLSAYGGGRTYRMMEPLGSAPVSRERSESNLRGAEKDEESSSSDEEKMSPSRIAMKGSLGSARVASELEKKTEDEEELSVSPGLPSTLQRALLSGGDEVLKLPSIHHHLHHHHHHRQPHRSTSSDSSSHSRSLSPPFSGDSPGSSSMGSPETIREEDSRPSTPTRGQQQPQSNVSLPSFTSLSLYPTLPPPPSTANPILPRLDTSSSSLPSTANSSRPSTAVVVDEARTPTMASRSPSSLASPAPLQQPAVYPDVDPAKHIELIKMLLVQVNASWRRKQAQEQQQQQQEMEMREVEERAAMRREGSIEVETIVKVEMEA
jgi:hypothetical protein